MRSRSHSKVRDASTQPHPAAEDGAGCGWPMPGGPPPTCPPTERWSREFAGLRWLRTAAEPARPCARHGDRAGGGFVFCCFRGPRQRRFGIGRKPLPRREGWPAPIGTRPPYDIGPWKILWTLAKEKAGGGLLATSWRPMCIVSRERGESNYAPMPKAPKNVPTDLAQRCADWTGRNAGS